MKYIIKNNKIYGIASNNWDDLSNHPSINSILLDQARDYTTDELNIIKGPMSLEEYNAIDPKNPNTIYVVSTDTSTPLEQVNYLDLQNKPLINGVVLTGDKSLASLSIYSIAQIDNLMASLRAIKVVATKPSSSDIIPNTQYYVGTTTPYHVYLYDSNKNEIDLGTSEVQQIQAGSGLSLSNGVMDHSNSISPKTNTKITGVSYDGQGHITGKGSEYDISTTLSLSSTDLQIPTNKTIFNKTPQTTTSHLQAGELTTMDEFFALLVEAEDTTHVSNTTVRTGVGYVTLPQFIINDLTTIGLTNTGYGNAFFKAQKVKSTADVLYGYIELQYLNGFSSAINIKNSTGWSGWKLKQCDSFAPKQTTYISGEYSVFISANNAVFNFPTTTENTRAVDIRQFLVTFTNPITNSTAWGNCETRIMVNNHSAAGAETKIYQTVYVMSNGMVFNRIGILSGAQDITQIYENRASIRWQTWYPLKYPSYSVSDRLTSNVSCSNADMCVQGGIAYLRLGALTSTTNLTDADILKSGGFAGILCKQISYAPMFGSDGSITYIRLTPQRVLNVTMKANITYNASLSFPIGTELY